MSSALGKGGASGTLVNLDAQVNGGNFQPAQVSALVVQVLRHAGEGERVRCGGFGGGGQAGRAGLIYGAADPAGRSGCRIAAGGRKHDAPAGGRQHSRCGHTAVDRRSDSRLGFRGQIGGEIFAAAGQVCRGSSKTRRNQGGVFADVGVFPFAVVPGVNHFDGGGFAVVGSVGGLHGVFQRPGGDRQGQCGKQGQKKMLFHMTSFPPPPS